jgi:peptidyl-prolyl cis-trans isomerase C
MRLFDAQDRIASPPATAVRVNGQEISSATITREIQNHPADSPRAARESAARALVVRELLLQEARRCGLHGEQQDLGEGQRETREDALVRELLDKVLDLPRPSEDECLRFYKNNLKRFRSPPIWEPAHILVSYRVEDTKAKDDAKRLANQLAAVVCQHPDRFEDFARTHSACPSREQGGNLGQITPGQTTPEFEQALEHMTPGTITEEPVETSYGYHVIRLERRVDEQTLPFESVREKIADYLADSVFRRAVRQYVSLLAGQAKIEGIDIERAMSPLVQ